MKWLVHHTIGLALLSLPITNFELSNKFSNSQQSTLNVERLFTPNDKGFSIPFSAVDAGADIYIPYNKVYNKYEAIELRKNLTKLLDADPTSQSLNWALVRFYSSAPNYVGGNKSMALRYAANLYSLNYYNGCLAYEYIYQRNYEFSNAEMWYKKSLIATPPSGMQWKEFKYINHAPFGVAVRGNFNNQKAQPLYESLYGSYIRKAIIPICNNDCEYEIEVGFMRTKNFKSNELLITSY